MELECAASNGNRYPPYPIMTTALLCPNPNLRRKKKQKKKTQMVGQADRNEVSN